MNFALLNYISRISLNFNFLFVHQKFPPIYNFRCYSELNIMKVLNVAEKNDAAKNISALLSRNTARKRESPSKFNKIYEFEYKVFNRNCVMVMTSVSGHILDVNFTERYNNWSNIQPNTLFEAPIQKFCSLTNNPVKKNLQDLIRFCNVLIIWTDCDREGENIGFQVIDICKEVKPSLQIYRARFSEITYASINKALNNLEMPNKFVSDAVEVRRELDLRIGAVFTRFQTLFFRKTFPEISKKQIISYGSCQFPTLGFIVERFKSIAEFIPELFWQINVEHTIDNIKVSFEWKRGSLFDKQACEVLFDKCVESGTAEVKKVDTKPKTKLRPKPLNTVDFEKLASKKLKINAKEALSIAEHLYNKGLISYPRTETTIFPKELNLEPLVKAQTVDPIWGEFANKILKDGPNPFQGNKSDKAHPPIHPVKYSNSLSENEKKIYELIVRHFLACLSKHAQGLETSVEIVIGDESFVAKGLIISEINYLEVYPYDQWKNKEMPVYNVGDFFKPNISMKEGETSPPELLTEADLLGLMEKYGIGTDATQAEHIEKVKARLYAGLKNNKYFVPRTLGMALVESYRKIGYEVAKPDFRAHLEADLIRICENKISTQEVLSRHIKIHQKIYEGVQHHIQSFLDTLVAYLQVEERPVYNNIVNQNNSEPVIHCKSCGSPMVLKKKPNNSHFIKCSNPICKEAVYFPSTITNVTPTNEVCEKCGPDNYLVQLTFRSENTNNMPKKYVGCIRGCDENLFEILNSNMEQNNPSIPISSNNRMDSDSGFCSASGNSCDSVSSNFSVPNCDCGLQATRHQVKKKGPNINRYFYKCGKSSNFCNFFQWESKNDSSKNVGKFTNQITIANNAIPEEIRCYCAIPCIRNVVQKSGVNKGREFYSCGKGIKNLEKCNFFKWVDGENLNLNHYNNASKTKYQSSQQKFHPKISSKQFQKKI